MGIQLCISKAAENLSISHAKGVVCAARGLGSEYIPMPQSVMSQIYWTVAVPKMLYGLEIVPIKEKHISELEQAHRKFAKTIQGLSNNIPNAAPLATLGWVTKSSFIAMRKLIFLWQILTLPSDNIYKRMTELILCVIVQKGCDLFSNTPIGSMYECAQRYGFDGLLEQCLNTKNYGDIENMKIKIKSHIIEHEKKCWNATCLLYPELNMYARSVNNITPHTWWKIARVHPHLMKKICFVMSLLMGSQPKCFQCNFNRSTCALCCDIPDVPCHILFQCEALNPERLVHWQIVVKEMLLAMSGEANYQTRSKQNISYQDSTIHISMGGKTFMKALRTLSASCMKSGTNCIIGKLPL